VLIKFPERLSDRYFKIFHHDFIFQMTSKPEQIAKDLITQVIESRIQRASPFTPNPTDVLSIISSAESILRDEPGNLRLAGEHCVVGDIHGNIDILLRIFENHGYPPHRAYLFLGDYIDRGSNSCEVIILLYSLKVCFPDRVRLLRGNHEVGQMAEVYGFCRECQRRFGAEIYGAVIASFAALPLAATLARNFCVHGGISPRLQTADDVARIAKDFSEFGDNLASDLLWSDPRPDVGEFEVSPRGCGRLFGEDAVSQFVEQTGICDRIIRAHESCEDGYDWPFSEPTVLTLFSSCDYCEMMNDAGVAIVGDDGQPECATLPPLVPGQMKKRRVTFPEWALEAEEPPPVFDDSENALGIVIDV
jgi:diadenosine tetraphosphatase ApaH/serine/threonine PP2A family protein phosphatase